MVNENFGHKCWGASLVLYGMCVIDVSIYSWARILSIFVLFYFVWYGAARFKPGYKKIFHF